MTPPPGYLITVPPGNPDDLQIVAGNLRKIAKDVHTHGSDVSGEPANMARAWKSPAASTAADEATHLGTGITAYGGHIGNGANALADFAKALDTAQRAIRAQVHLADGVESAVNTDLAENDRFKNSDAQTQRLWAEEEIDMRMRPIMAAVNNAQCTLDTAAKTCAGKLTSAIP